MAFDMFNFSQPGANSPRFYCKMLVAGKLDMNETMLTLLWHEFLAFSSQAVPAPILMASGRMACASHFVAEEK
jgi:hypothetical protein